MAISPMAITARIPMSRYVIVMSAAGVIAHESPNHPPIGRSRDAAHLPTVIRIVPTCHLNRKYQTAMAIARAIRIIVQFVLGWASGLLG